MACPICDNKPANCDCSDVELEMHERITSQAARFKALEADVAAAARWREAQESVLANTIAERDALRAEVARLKDPDALRNVNARDNIARIKNLQAALDEALASLSRANDCCGCPSTGDAPIARIRAIAAGK